MVATCSYTAQAHLSDEEMQSGYSRLVSCLSEHVDVLLIETVAHTRFAALALQAIRHAGARVPVHRRSDSSILRNLRVVFRMQTD